MACTCVTCQECLDFYAAWNAWREERDRIEAAHWPEIHRLSHSSLPREPFYAAQERRNAALAAHRRLEPRRG